MHNCSKIHHKIMDLVFNEVSEDERFALLQELNTCQPCRAFYRDMTETLMVFDSVTDEIMPEETYWAAYEERLWSGLRSEIKPAGWRQRFISWISYKPVFGLPLPALASAVALLLVVALWIFIARPAEVKQVASSESIPNTMQKDPDQQPTEQAGATKTEEENDKQDSAPADSQQKYHKSQKRGLELVALPRRNQLAEKTQSVDLTTSLTARLSEHTESAMVLLRSFRNARPTAGEETVDISFERGMARNLLANNAQLRQEVETVGDLRSDELLAGLEPALLDIANLPDRASTQEIGVVKDVLEKFGLITELQIYSAIALNPRL